jgi:hypothetical protein
MADAFDILYAGYQILKGCNKVQVSSSQIERDTRAAANGLVP